MSSLFPGLAPPKLPSTIDLRCGDVRDLVREVRGATLVHSDAPWKYRESPGVANPDDNAIYGGMEDSEISAILDAAYECAAPGARLVCWLTWPKLDEFRDAGDAGRWRYVTGGSWQKLQSQGVGHHWLGRSELVRVYTKPGASYRDTAFDLGNAHASVREEHSRKPLDWLRGMVRRWTPPDALVLDLWAGLAPMAAACRLEGRRYVGAEIDADRHAAGTTFAGRAE